jgi:hypothetical protein
MKKFAQARKYQAGRGHGTSSAGLPGKRRWRAGLAAAAGIALLAVAGCTGTTTKSVAGGTGGTGSSPGGAGSQGSGTSEGSAGKASSHLGSGKGGQPTAGGQAAAINGVLFGGDVPLVPMEAKLGRTLAIVRVYDLIGQPFMNRKVASIMARGSTLLVSFDTFPSHGPSYASIVAGREDSTIRSFLEAANQAAIHYKLGAIYVTFEHEANNLSKHRGLGTPAQFLQAWDHVHQLAVNAHLDWNQGGRLHWALILTHYAFLNGSISQYWPGTSEVDVVAADGYNTGGCRDARRSGGGFKFGRTPAVTPASLFAKVVGFAASHGRLPVFIAEWGSVAYTSTSVRVSFIQQMQAFVQANPEIKATLYWNSQVPPCNYIVNGSPTSLAALASMGHSPALQGQLAN